MSPIFQKQILAAALWCVGLSAAFGQTQTVQEQEAGLIAVLQSKAERKAKVDACRELARIGTEAAVPALAALLKDEALSHMARYGLEAIPGPAAGEALRAALPTLTGLPRIGVIASLGARRDEKAVAALAGLLRDADPAVAAAAARALGAIATQAAGEALAAAVVMAKGEAARPACDALLSCAMALASGSTKPLALAWYDQVAKTEAPADVRAAAAGGAIRLRNDVEGMMKLLQSDDPHMASMGLRLAQDLPGEAVTAALVAPLGQWAPEKMLPLIQVLGYRADKAAAPALIALAKKADKPVRLAALRALGQVGDVSAAPVLLVLMQEADADVAQGAAASLAGLPAAAVDDEIIRRLEASGPAARVGLIGLVGQRRIAKALPRLRLAMKDEDEAVRLAAIRGVGAMAGPEELPFLIDALVDTARPNEIRALEKEIGSLCARTEDRAEAVRRLVAGLPKAAVESKLAILRLLRVAGGSDALNAVRGAMGDSHKDVHAAALRVLGEWNTVDAAPLLLDLAKSATEPTDKILSLRGYLGMASKGDLSPEARMAICREAAGLVQRAEEKTLLLGTLRQIGNGEALERAAGYLDDADVKGLATATVLAVADKLGAKPPAPAVKKALEKVAQDASQPAEAAKAQALLKKWSAE